MSGNSGGDWLRQYWLCNNNCRSANSGRSGHVHGVKQTEGRLMEGGVQVLKDDSTSHCMAARDTV